MVAMVIKSLTNRRALVYKRWYSKSSHSSHDTPSRIMHLFSTFLLYRSEIHGENDTVADGKYSVTFTSSSDELPRWVPDFRKEACENLRKYFPVIVELPDSEQS